ncbi:hypothetical protein EV356DRAFT_502427 [Viridothelium virens]|uniref:GPR1/FUN34/YaaH-class plasma membrane protein n=1 Tax=Viridothelium virens TaxID=1048519 RepID=A0A6A6HMJ9_VIRVR|nr:hypothetical protein EV356DRAFT_502427 [Viridothelium virens]
MAMNDRNGGPSNRLERAATEVQDHAQNLLHKARTSGSITIDPALFERLYLNPEVRVKGQLRNTFANPTPLALCGFLLATTAFACDTMGWRGAGGNGAASTGPIIFMGGMLQIVGGIMEWILGNTFICVVLNTYGAFWLSYGTSLQPFYNTAGFYSSNPGAADAASQLEGMKTPAYMASLAFWFLFMGLLTFFYMVLALKVNITLVFTLLMLGCTYCVNAAAFWYNAEEQTVTGSRLQLTGGATTFTFCVSVWYIFTSQMAAAVDFPIQLPVGDLSQYRWLKGSVAKTEEEQRKEN